jgi:hypothetical protein
MRIQYMSDLHMELWDNSRYIKANEFDVVGDVLVLGGDTFYLRDTIAPQNWATILPTVASMPGFMVTRIRISTPRLATPESCAISSVTYLTTNISQMDLNPIKQ